MKIEKHFFREEAIKGFIPSVTLYLLDRVDNAPLRPMVMIIPGGGYVNKAENWEGERIAIEYNRAGFNAAVLNYSVYPIYHPQPLLDAMDAIAFIRKNALSWQCDPNMIVVLGFSAGGHVTALYNDYWHTKWLRRLSGVARDQLRPNAVILGYPVIDLNLGFPKDATTRAKWADDPARYNAAAHVNDLNEPTFMWTTFTDQVVPVQNTLSYSQALLAHRIPQELHVFAHGPHGMDIANALVAHHDDVDQPHVAHWVELACEWIDDLFK